MTILYHGSYLAVPSPFVGLGRKKVDFGQGFYLTKLRSQAQSWDMEWLDYVIEYRSGGEMQKQYDIVEGGVANDNVIDTVEDYENGIITAEQAIGQLVYKKVNHQICILNQ